MRCRALAQVLRERGAEILFVARHMPDELRDLLLADGHACAFLPAAAGGDMGSDLYAEWLGATEEEDARATLAALEEFAPEVVVVDHYALSLRWESMVHPASKMLLAIDDIARAHASDALLDQNFAVEPLARYKGRVPSGCLLLLGARYVLLRPEYIDAARSPRDPGKPVRRIVVFFGGVDAGDMSGRSLEALNDGRFADLDVDIVIGPANPHAARITAAAARRKRTYIHQNLSSLADLFANADIAIGAGGTATWERCCCGVPSLVVTVADNQKPASLALAQNGIIRYLGDQSDVGAGMIAIGLHEMIADSNMRASMSQKGRLLVDGWGAARVAEILAPTPPYLLQVRPSSLTDCEFLFQLANDPLVRAQSYNSADIRWEDHVSWFAAKRQDQNVHIFILTARGLSVGMIRFEIKGGHAVLNYALDAVARGRKWGSALVEKGLRALAGRWEGDVHASVKSENIASRSVFERLAFETSSVGPGQFLFLLRAKDLKLRYGS